MTSSPFRVRMLRLTAVQDGIASRRGIQVDAGGLGEVSDWYMVETKLHMERLALKELARKVPVVFLPLRELTDIADGRRRCRTVPLFPSHLFVGVNRAQSLTELKYAPGVRGNGSNWQPVPVSAAFVDRLMRLARVPDVAQRKPNEQQRRREFLSGFETFKSLFRGEASDNERIAVLFSALRS